MHVAVQKELQAEIACGRVYKPPQPGGVYSTGSCTGGGESGQLTNPLQQDSSSGCATLATASLSSAASTGSTGAVQAASASTVKQEATDAASTLTSLFMVVSTVEQGKVNERSGWFRSTHGVK
jgi:hypothetical protein